MCVFLPGVVAVVWVQLVTLLPTELSHRYKTAVQVVSYLLKHNLKVVSVTVLSINKYTKEKHSHQL